MLTAITAAACGMYCARRTGPSRIILVIHLVAVVIPLQALVAAGFELAQPEFATAVGGAFLLTMLLCAAAADIEFPIVSRRVRIVAILVLVLLTLSYSVHWNPWWARPYKFRSDARIRGPEEFLEVPRHLLAISSWQGYVLNPIMMLVGLRRRFDAPDRRGPRAQGLLFAMTAAVLSYCVLDDARLVLAGNAAAAHDARFAGAMAIVAVTGSVYAL